MEFFQVPPALFGPAVPDGEERPTAHVAVGAMQTGRLDLKILSCTFSTFLCDWIFPEVLWHPTLEANNYKKHCVSFQVINQCLSVRGNFRSEKEFEGEE